jgi:acyl-coenzyme A synthetase/AMP-(fatty) acid ligase
MSTRTKELPQANMTDYEKARREFELEVPEFFNFGFDVVDRWAADRTKLALMIADELGEQFEKLTFNELKRESDKFVDILINNGLKKGDRVLLMLTWMPHWYVAMIGMIKLGVIPIPCTYLLTPKDIIYRLRIVDNEGNEMEDNQEGYVAVRVRPDRPVGLFKEYWKRPDEAKMVFQGYYYTGDKAYRDEDGYFWFVGRADDVILSSGYHIGPFEVESALVEHPAVAESAVIAAPDEVRGEVVKAFVVLAEEYEGSEALVREIQEHVKEVTAPYKYPRQIEFVKTLPKTVSGKIRRSELKSQEWKAFREKKEGDE